MLCLGLKKKSLPSPRLELTAQGVAYRCSKVECEDHSVIQAPRILKTSIIKYSCLQLALFVFSIYQVKLFALSLKMVFQFLGIEHGCLC